MSQGLVTSIQHYATKDGPGLRTTVFLTGCNLRCAWCANPESMAPGTKVMYHAERCRRCGRCVALSEGTIAMGPRGCVIDRTRCGIMDRLPEICDQQAYEAVGRTMTAKELAAKLLRDEDFYRTSGGGVTFSGGECLLQAGFVEEVIDLLKPHGINVALDTAGLWDYAAAAPVIAKADLMLYDVKSLDDEVHVRYTGVSNRPILENLRRLASAGTALVLRLIVVPSINDSRAELTGRIDLAVGLGRAVRQVDLLRYHDLARGKYKALGMDYPMEGLRPQETDLQWALDYGRRQGLKMTIGG